MHRLTGRGFLEFARSLPAHDIYNAIKEAQPISDFVTHKLPSNLRRHYEKMTRFPLGYLVVGDAICSFNPVYGQGMTVSAIGAEALEDCLKIALTRDGLDTIAPDFFRKAARAVDHAWTLAVGEDLRYPQVEGPRPLGTDLVHWYMEKVQHATLRDKEISRLFYNIMTMTHSPGEIFKPAVLVRVLRQGLRPPSVSATVNPFPVRG
jgi:2-polyprenyl-6-methoxyphenol hydroxylase-like FAD-dependent oxidoreductase